ncbi:MAG: cell division protein ZapD [Microcystis aeruginosa PMC 728.11]|nr:cell division protein ZapD [Microcystis aeruginosa PMC 728.11]
MTATIEDIWEILKELAQSQQELSQSQQELSQSQQELSQSQQELSQAQQELSQAQKETDQQIKETDKQINRVSQQIGELGNRLGEFVEWQVRPAVVRLFQERGIDVHEFHPGISVKRDNEGLEIDLLVVNDTDAILVEVKSKLTQRDVDEHLQRLAKFKRLMPRFRDVKALGAVAAMIVPNEVASYACRQGLFVLVQSGENVIILNDAEFTPQVW